MLNTDMILALFPHTPGKRHRRRLHIRLEDLNMDQESLLARVAHQTTRMEEDRGVPGVHHQDREDFHLVHRAYLHLGHREVHEHNHV